VADKNNVPLYYCPRAAYNIKNEKMKKIALIYWPKKGNVEKAANKIYKKFDEAQVDLFTITSVDIDRLSGYDVIIIGGSTVGADNWEDTHKSRWLDFFMGLEGAKIDGKVVAIFGLGDQILYPEHFVDGMAHIKSELSRHDVRFVGKWPTEGYEHTDSKALEGDHFIGLALDDDQQPELTDERIERWVEMIKKEF
jgi:flavodoxin I